VFHVEETRYNDADFSWTDGVLGYKAVINTEHQHSWFAVHEDEARRTPFGDYITTDAAVTSLRNLSSRFPEHGENFFLAVGFKRPHLPLTVLDKYLDEYALDDIQLPVHPHPPEGTDPTTFNGAEEFIGYADIQEYFQDGEYKLDSSFPDAITRELRRAYYACVSMIDDHVGEIMRQLDDFHLRDSTIIVFMADHGYHLGESGVWGKSTVWEHSLHVPLMMSIPGMPSGSTEELVELVDVYPTLVEAAGLGSMSECGSEWLGFCAEGSSMIPLIAGETSAWKRAVFSQIAWPYVGTMEHSGYSVRTDRVRYTEWLPFTGGFPTTWGNITHRELFVLDQDPHQTENQVDNPDFQEMVEDLARNLHGNWRGARAETLLR
jgi:iduronate 2-sulfatase